MKYEMSFTTKPLTGRGGSRRYQHHLYFLLFLLLIIKPTQPIHQRQRTSTVSSTRSTTATGAAAGTSTSTSTSASATASATASDDDALFAYSTMIVEGGKVQDLEREVNNEVIRKKVPKMDEQTSTVEYSSMIADKAEDSDKEDSNNNQDDATYTSQPPNTDDP